MIWMMRFHSECLAANRGRSCEVTFIHCGISVTLPDDSSIGHVRISEVDAPSPSGHCLDHAVQLRLPGPPRLAPPGPAVELSEP
jgi:hypothetical protein